MKMVLMTYYVGLHDEVMEILSRLDVCTYTRWREVEGRIACGEPRENSHVWPGVNSSLMVVIDDAKVQALMTEIEGFNRARSGEGIDAYVLGVEAATLSG